MPKLRIDILPSAQARVWQFFAANAQELQRHGFYLAGGTGLALQLGHRRSVDFDFFSQEQDTTASLQPWLETGPDFLMRDWNADTIHAELQQTKVSFIGGYKYPLVAHAILSEGIPIAAVADIALMKLLAITHRATLRDYLDLAAVLRDRIGLQELFQLSRKKYGGRLNFMTPLKSLVSFGDLDQEMPLLLDRTLAMSWQDILTRAVKDFTQASG